MGDMGSVCRRNLVGLEVGRDTWVLHAWVRCCCADSDSGVGSYSASGQGVWYEPDSVCVDGGITDSSAVGACAGIGRGGRLELFSHAAGVFVAGNIILHVCISPKS